MVASELSLRLVRALTQATLARMWLAAGHYGSVCPFRRPWEACSASKTRHDAAPLSIDGSVFRNRLAGRRLLFVGDSLHVQMAVALACQLHAQDASSLVEASLNWWPANSAGTLRKRCAQDSAEAGRCHWEKGCIRFHPNITVCTCFVSTLAGQAKCLNDLTASDLLVYGSIALYYGETHQDPSEVAQAARAEVANLFSNERLRSLRLPVIWREVTAQHFISPGGHYRGSVDYNLFNRSQRACTKHPYAEMVTQHLWNGIANPLVHAHGARILPVWEQTSMNSRDHLGYGDCTHFCSPGVPDRWVELLDHELRMSPALRGPAPQLQALLQPSLMTQARPSPPRPPGQDVCTSQRRSDSTVKKCSPFCNATRSSAHCSWCKCQECGFCSGSSADQGGGQRRQQKTHALRIVVCLFGTIVRSIERTWPIISSRIIAPLAAAGLQVDIYGYNVELVPGDYIDGVKTGHRRGGSVVRTVPFTVYESALQANIDRLVEAKCADTPTCKLFLPDKAHIHGPLELRERQASSRNCLRQLYSEWRVGSFLRSQAANVYDVAIVLGPDFHPALSIDAEEVRSSAKLRNTVYTTNISDGMFAHMNVNLSITNGFYFGAPGALSKVLRRYDDLEAIRMYLSQFRRVSLDYEAVLGGALRLASIQRAVTRMVFFKIRSNGVPDWQGQHNIRSLPEGDQLQVVLEWRKLVYELCALEYTDPKYGVPNGHYMCACHGQARFGSAGTWSFWRPVQMATSRRAHYIRCDSRLFGMPQFRANATRRSCQCRLNTTHHVDVDGLYSLPRGKRRSSLRHALISGQGQI